MAYGDYNNISIGTEYSTFKTGNTDSKKTTSSAPGYIDLSSAKSEASELSKMAPAEVMAYLNNMSADKKAAIGRELLNTVTDPQMKAELNKMLELLPKETATKVSKFTTQKAIDSIASNYESTVMPGMKLAEDGAIAANLTSFPEDDLLGDEFSQMFKAIA